MREFFFLRCPNTNQELNSYLVIQTRIRINYLCIENDIGGHMYVGAWVETEENCPECSSPDTVENANRGLLYCKSCEKEIKLSEITAAPSEFLVFSNIA